MLQITINNTTEYLLLVKKDYISNNGTKSLLLFMHKTVKILDYRLNNINVKNTLVKRLFHKLFDEMIFILETELDAVNNKKIIKLFEKMISEFSDWMIEELAMINLD